MHVRVYLWEYAFDPWVVEEMINASIQSAEDVGEKVLDVSLVVRPNKGAVKHEGIEYLVILKCEGPAPSKP